MFQFNFFTKTKGYSMNKKSILTLIFLGVFALSAYSQEVYKVDVNKSKVIWTGTKVGGRHEGTLKIKSGTVTLKNGYLASAEVVVDMNSIQCTDLKDKALNDKLVNHLKSADFFEVDKYPEAKFVVTKPDRRLNQDYMVYGKLTIKDKTSDVKFPATLIFEDNNKNFMTTISFVFDRTKHDIKYGSEKFFKNLGDKAIYDEVDVLIELHASK